MNSAEYAVFLILFEAAKKAHELSFAKSTMKLRLGNKSEMKLATMDLLISGLTFKVHGENLFIITGE